MTLPIFDKPAAYADYDATARALPGCEHNQAWWKQGRGRPQPPDCEHNRLWRTKLRADWLTYLAASDNDRNRDSNPVRGHQRTTGDKGARDLVLPHPCPRLSAAAQDYGSEGCRFESCRARHAHQRKPGT